MRNAVICTLIFMISAMLTSCLKEKAIKAAPSSSGASITTTTTTSSSSDSTTTTTTISFSSLIGSSWTVLNKTTSQSTRTGTTVSNNYIGQAGDYFNFTTYGKLYWSINGQSDTATYVISGDTIIMTRTHNVDPMYLPNYTISNLTEHTCTLFNWIAIPDANGGGPHLTTINLKK